MSCTPSLCTTFMITLKMAETVTEAEKKIVDEPRIEERSDVRGSVPLKDGKM